ncbi:GNAT family N-acetyltransferase [Runella sp. CRIBMP]|uniref:GNAT family N-acetyltransferase n=1 Tax=Runella sp. CRIBMP TaxID=2683261 RepID=UPI001412495A|nr:GNAT family N-acetyltransferase [Runella sp. CRIBMP]NBB23221.1 GNAT family N-acetyltransferase [Runella sp. CRIBMP]
MDITFRTYELSDRTELEEIFLQNTPKYFAPEELGDFLEYLDIFGDDYVVAVVDGRIVGGGGYWIRSSDHQGGLSWAFLRPDFQGTGVGKALAVYRIDLIKASGGAKMILVETSQHSFGFYEKLGFKLLSQQPDYWAPGIDLYSAVLELE